jgi:hypothetical protein
MLALITSDMYTHPRTHTLSPTHRLSRPGGQVQTEHSTRTSTHAHSPAFEAASQQPPRLFAPSLSRSRPRRCCRCGPSSRPRSVAATRSRDPPSAHPTRTYPGQVDAHGLYHLYAVVVHVDLAGSANAGHYVAYVKARGGGANGAWFKADDSKVRDAGLQEVLGAQAYLLFYQRAAPVSLPSLPSDDELLAKAVALSRQLSGNPSSAIGCHDPNSSNGPPAALLSRCSNDGDDSTTSRNSNDKTSNIDDGKRLDGHPRSDRAIDPSTPSTQPASPTPTIADPAAAIAPNATTATAVGLQALADDPSRRVNPRDPSLGRATDQGGPPDAKAMTSPHSPATNILARLPDPSAADPPSTAAPAPISAVLCAGRCGFHGYRNRSPHSTRPDSRSPADKVRPHAGPVLALLSAEGASVCARLRAG